MKHHQKKTARPFTPKERAMLEQRPENRLESADYPPVSNDNGASQPRPKVNCAPGKLPMTVPAPLAAGLPRVPRSDKRPWDMKFALGLAALVIIINLSLTLLLGPHAESAPDYEAEKKTPAISTASIAEPAPLAPSEPVAEMIPPAMVPAAVQEMPAETTQVETIVQEAPPPAPTPETSPLPPRQAMVDYLNRTGEASPGALEPAAAPTPAPVVDRQHLLNILNQY